MKVNPRQYWLKNAHIPVSLIGDSIRHRFREYARENLTLCDLQIVEGKIHQIIPSHPNTIGIDLEKKILLPCFLDCHTHLDKTHTVERSPNLQGDFKTAIDTLERDKEKWDEEDLYRRMDFALQCAYSHGTIAIRTHLDCDGGKGEISLRVWQQLREKWKDKIILQVVSLVSLDYFLTPQGEKLADTIASVGGILGGVAYMNPEIDRQLLTVFQLAKERHLPLDFHADENGNEDSICLRKIAQTALKTDFPYPILCGHCCSLAVQSPEVVGETISLLRQTPIAIVSLPLCNLYLQDRKPNTTPFWRGITRVKELKQAGIPVAFASDNCRDGFFAFGDYDMLEVFNQAVRIAHLDTPYSNWIDSVTRIPAQIMNLPLGQISPLSAADFIIFSARNYSELLSRPQCNRLVVRGGKILCHSLPSYDFLPC